MTKAKTHFASRTAIRSKTPSWANNAVAITIILLGVVHFIVKGDPTVPAETSDRIILYTDGLAMAITAISRLFGVTYEKAT